MVVEILWGEEHSLLNKDKKRKTFNLAGCFAVCDNNEYKEAQESDDGRAICLTFRDIDKLPKWWIREASDKKNRFPYDPYHYYLPISYFRVVSSA